MIKLQELKLRNFRSFGNKTQSIRLDNLGLTLLVGKNKDSFQSNGAGKSSLLNAIVYALYNVTSNGVKGNSLINNKIKHNMCVQLLFKKGNNEYLIKRYRKDSKNKNKTFLFRNKKNITQRSIKKTNELIGSIVGVDKRTYLHSYMFSGTGAKFASLTDKGKKKVLDDMIDLSIYPIAQDISKNDAKHTKDKIDNAESKLDATEYSLKITVDLQSSVYQNNKNRINKAHELRNNLINQKKKCLKLTNYARIAQHNIAQDKAFIKKQMPNLHQYKSNYNKLNQMSQRVINCSLNEKKYKKQLLEIQDQIKQDKDKIAQLSSGKQRKCYWCGQILNKQEKAHELTKLAEDIISAKSVLIKSQNQYKSSIKFLTMARQDKHKLSHKLADASKINELINNKHDDISSNRQQLVSLKLANSKLHDLKAQFHSINNTQAINYAPKMTALANKIKSQTTMLKKLKIAYRLYNESKKIYSDTGIRSMLLDLILPFINKQANYYLQLLTDGSITILIVPTTTSKSTGNTSEKINMKVNNSHGASSYDDLSAGEKRRTNLAIILALQDYVLSKSETSMNLICMDELFDNLDAAGVRGVIRLLTRRAKKFPNIIVVSHNDKLKQMFSNYLVVTKKNGFSTISE